MGRRYAIVGFGCAGYHALEALRQSDSQGEIHVFSELDQPPANPMLTTYYAAGRLPYEALFPFGSLEEVERKLSPVLHMDAPVAALEKDERALTLATGERMAFDAVLLATGAQPVVPPLGVTVGERVLCMRTVADARRLRQRLEAGDVRSVTVIGASMVGIKIVELCGRRASPAPWPTWRSGCSPWRPCPTCPPRSSGGWRSRGWPCASARR